MNERETYYAIESGNAAFRQRALFELLRQVQACATAVLELAGEKKLETGRDPLTIRPRTILSDFIELPPERD